MYDEVDPGDRDYEPVGVPRTMFARALVSCTRDASPGCECASCKKSRRLSVVMPWLTHCHPSVRFVFRLRQAPHELSRKAWAPGGSRVELWCRRAHQSRHPRRFFLANRQGCDRRPSPATQPPRQLPPKRERPGQLCPRFPLVKAPPPHPTCCQDGPRPLQPPAARQTLRDRTGRRGSKGPVTRQRAPLARRATTHRPMASV